MKFNLAKIQEQPYEVRVRIAWTVGIVMAVILFGLWIFSTQRHIQKLDGISLPDFNPSNTNSIQGTQNYMSLEWIEETDKEFKVFFKANNNTSNILSFSKAEDITLTADKDVLHPKFVQDRQGTAFSVKILSNTEKFGVLIFEKTKTLPKDVELKFDNLYFEVGDEAPFYQTIPINLKALNKSMQIGE